MGYNSGFKGLNNYAVVVLNNVMCNISNTFDTRGILVVGDITRRLLVSVIKLTDLFHSIMLLATAEAECGTF